MRPVKLCLLGLLALMICGLELKAAPATKALDIYFIDVEGGAATLIVTPLRESLLVDSGFPGERDSKRIAHVARDVAGLSQIDHYITTHWHQDHVGGVPDLSKLIPIKNFYDHGIPDPLTTDIQPALIDAYRKTVENKSVILKPGDTIKLRPAVKYLPPLQVRVLAADGIVLGEKPGAAQIQPCGENFKAQPEDKSDNNKSIGFLLSFGRFRFFDGGDLTWNIENRLVCPKNLVGAIDVYQADHHGLDSSNNPELIRGLQPRVAIIGNGPRKGGEPRTYASLKTTPGVEAIYQLHRNVRTSDGENASPDFVANDAEQCQGEFIKLSVAGDGKSYTVAIPAKNITRTYKVR